MKVESILSRAGNVSAMAYQMSHCDGYDCDCCGTAYWCNKVSGDRTAALVICSAVIDELIETVEALRANQKVPYAHWDTTTIINGDGEEEIRYICSHCGSEAPFGCDPDGFATFQERSPFCAYCHAIMTEDCTSEQAE